MGFTLNFDYGSRNTDLTKLEFINKYMTIKDLEIDHDIEGFKRLRQLANEYSLCSVMCQQIHHCLQLVARIST